MEIIAMEENIKRVATPIALSTNPFGHVVAMLIMMRADAFTEFAMIPVAEFVTDDLQYGDHVRISSKITAGENEGALNTRVVVIHHVPEGVRDIVVRFANYGRDDHVITYRASEFASLKIAAINYLTTGDIHPQID